MIVTVRDWYGARSPRERTMLLALAAIALPLLLWFALIVPLDRTYDRALERQLDAVDRHSRILSLAGRAKGSSAVRLAPVADLGLFLADNARQAGLTAISSAAPQPGAATVTIASATPPLALEWLRGLEAQGYAISDMRITPAANGAAAGGSVAVMATIGGAR